MPVPLFFRDVTINLSQGALPSSEERGTTLKRSNTLTRRLSIRRRRKEARNSREKPSSNEAGGGATQGLTKSEKRE